jgi:hypothetical protein
MTQTRSALIFADVFKNICANLRNLRSNCLPREQLRIVKLGVSNPRITLVLFLPLILPGKLPGRIRVNLEPKMTGGLEGLNKAKLYQEPHPSTACDEIAPSHSAQDATVIIC